MRLELFLGEVKHLAERAAAITIQIQKELQSGIVTDIAALIPGGTPLDMELQALCSLALKGCAALAVIGDSAGVKARLERLGVDMTWKLHGGKHKTFRYYIAAFEVALEVLKEA